MEKVYIASDLGASSGRVIAGSFNGSHLKLQETNRFDNPQTDLLGHVHWDMVALYRNIVDGMRCARTLGTPVSIGIDTWGVDYGRLWPAVGAFLFLAGGHCRGAQVRRRGIQGGVRGEEARLHSRAQGRHFHHGQRLRRQIRLDWKRTSH